MNRVHWTIGLPLFIAACGSGGGNYGSAAAPAPVPPAAATPSPSIAGPGYDRAPGKTASPAPEATPPSASVLAVQNAKLGILLADPQGRTLYYFVPERGGNISCTGQCMIYWPPAAAAGSTPTGGAGVIGQLGTIARPGGGVQITYDAWPLYRFSSDNQPGQTNGQGVDAFGGKWYAATPALRP